MAWAGTPVAATCAIPMLSAASAAINSAANYRQGFLGALLGPAPGGPMLWRSGVLPTSLPSGTIPVDLVVTQTGTASANVLVSAGTGVVSRSGAAGGPYTVLFASTSTVAVDPGASTNPRIDVLCVQLVDVAIGDSGNQGGQLLVVDGTPAASPAVPSIPTGAIALAQILRPTNAATVTTAQITDVRKGACTLGGVRALLPGDALSDPGSYAGEMRTRYHSTYGQLVDVWGVNNAWHGTCPITTGFTQVWANGTSDFFLNGPGFINQVISVAVADPGWPYTVSASGVCSPRSEITWSAGSPPWANAGIYVDTIANPASAQSYAAAFLNVIDANYSAVIGEFTSPVLTGAHTVYLGVQASAASNSQEMRYTDYVGNGSRASSLTYLKVRLNPA